MVHDTCIADECTNPRTARSLCRRHYGIAHRNGSLPPLATPPKHLLSDVDMDNAVAICAVCGPVEIRVRRDGKSHECMTLRRSSRGRRGGTKYLYSDKLKYKYRITQDDYEDMAERQAGHCAICSKPSEKLVVDHDHATGRVRELLCHRCNITLGFLRDDVDVARSAVEYILKHAAA